MTELSLADSPKTRVLLFTSHPQISSLVKYVLAFHGKNIDFAPGSTSGEFLIKETLDLEDALQFKPNIAFISSETPESEIIQIANHLTGGGVLVYPNKHEDAVEEISNYFRRMPYEDMKGKISGDSFTISTEMGDLPLQFNDENLVRHLQGVQLLLQQFVIMEEDFYEALMSFKF